MSELMIYEHLLPAERDPAVVALADHWIDVARRTQRPLRALAYAVPSTALGVALWGELNVWTEFSMHWYVMAGSALALGVLLGRPCRSFGSLFDRRWAALIGVCGFVMALTGDLYGAIGIVAARTGTDWGVELAGFGANDLTGWLGARTPLDWLVSGIAAVGAGLAARPQLDERQLVMEARIEIYRQRTAHAPSDAHDDAA